jgi:hypothetical protein
MFLTKQFGFLAATWLTRTQLAQYAVAFVKLCQNLTPFDLRKLHKCVRVQHIQPQRRTFIMGNTTLTARFRCTGLKFSRSTHSTLLRSRHVLPCRVLLRDENFPNETHRLSSQKLFVSFAFGREDKQKHRFDAEAIIILATHRCGPG